ncbi:MAG: methyltransferase domain-containing protein [Sedimentisphaerales bacterium]|nr:methyltransferase domain-containing protein [Sedimentisphaerales bacterium]
MKVLNLGCGVKVSHHPDVTNIDWSIYLRIRRNPILRALTPIFVRGYRLHNLQSLPGNIMVWNLSKGIPFTSNSVDAVYHSHLLEHLDRDIAEVFLKEIYRVLKPGGIQRIVVPDFEMLCRRYLQHIHECEICADEIDGHDHFIGDILEQCVRKESSKKSPQRPLQRWIEKILLGDARRRGETHQWMYDRFNLHSSLHDAGFSGVYLQNYNTSLIPSWDEYGLDLNTNQKQYKPGSLYMEAIK